MDGGPPVKQATNAYRLTLPPAAEKLLGHLAGPPPAPEDIEHARAARMAAAIGMVNGLPLDEQPAAAGVIGHAQGSAAPGARGRNPAHADHRASAAGVPVKKGYTQHAAK